MTLKPTIVEGEWVYLPPPPQDSEYLRKKEEKDRK